MLGEAPLRPAPAKLWASALIGLAALLALASYVMHWAKLTYPRTATDTANVYVGYRSVGLYFGLLLLLRAALTWRLSGTRSRRWGGFAIVSAAFVGGYAIYDLATEQSRSVAQLVANTAASLRLPVSQVKAAIDAQVASGLVKVTFTGAWVALAAAALAAAGGVISLAMPLERSDPGWMPERLARGEPAPGGPAPEPDGPFPSPDLPVEPTPG